MIWDVARSTVEAITDTMRGLSPSLVRQILPLVEQLTPIYMDVAQGRQEFSPAPEETSKLIRNYYNVNRNLLLRFQDDSIDETIELASLLQSSSAISSRLDVTVRTLPGEQLWFVACILTQVQTSGVLWRNCFPRAACGG